MTLLIDGELVREVATEDVALRAARAALDDEARGRTRLPVRTDTPSGSGFLRVMPAVLGDVMGLKVMTLVEGLGTRYLVLMYSVNTGELLAVFDAAELTRQRTAATSAVAGELMVDGSPTRMGLVGSAFEAEAHLRAVARLWPLQEVRVFSRSEANREGFAKRMRDALDIDVRAVPDITRATSDLPVVVIATKSTEPVVDGAAFAPGTVVLSIGSTRPDLRELDVVTLRRATVLVVDSRPTVMSESGDVMAALDGGAIDEEQIQPLGRVANERSLLARSKGRDLLVFKSVGTALQDLALARAVHQEVRASGRGRELVELCRLKHFASTAGTRQ